MNTKTWMAGAACWMACALSVAAPASEAAIRELMEVTQARKLMEDMQGQMAGFVRQGVQQGLQGRTPNPKQQQVLDDMIRQVAAVVGEGLAWDRMEPLYLSLYRETFTEEEVSGMLAFYRTPAGQALIHKMPVLMQKTMAEIPKMQAAMMPRLVQIQREAVAALREAEAAGR